MWLSSFIIYVFVQFWSSCMGFRVLLFILFSLALSTSFSSYALGKLGHQLVCQLSYDLLSMPQQQKIDQLLSDLPTATKKLINKYNYQKENSDINYAKACTWADAIKRDKSFDSYKPWHYVNVNRDQDTIDANSCKQDCLTAAITFHSSQLAQSDSPKEQAQALMFLGHWLGDLHQPLHVSFASDLGGNKVNVKPKFGKCKNLHWYWDQCLLYVEELPKDVSPFQFLYQQLTANLNKVETPKWQESEVYKWANESITLVRSAEFGYCEKEGVHCLPLSNGGTEITLAYHKKYHQILQQRIILAAHRLTSILNKVL